MPRTFVALGSNLGDRRYYLDYAVARFRAHEAVQVQEVATYLETEPVGDTAQGKFLNTVVQLCTALTPHALLALAQEIELAAKRVRTRHWGPRTLDIDILLYGDLVLLTPELIIPHPRLREREFVLAPLAEIAPSVQVPPDNSTAGFLLCELRQRVLPCSS